MKTDFLFVGNLPHIIGKSAFIILDKSVCRKDLRQPGGHGTTRGAHRQHNTDDDDYGDDDGRDGDGR